MGCDTITETQCLGLAQIRHAQKVSGKSLQVAYVYLTARRMETRSPESPPLCRQVVKSSHIPAGCSVHSGGDWSVYFNTDTRTLLASVLKKGYSPIGGYTQVCNGGLQRTVCWGVVCFSRLAGSSFQVSHRARLTAANSLSAIPVRSEWTIAQMARSAPTVRAPTHVACAFMSSESHICRRF